jgi:hypothetical protein
LGQICDIGQVLSKNFDWLSFTPLWSSYLVLHLHRMRRGRWLSAGVSEINLRNPALNHTT